MSINMLNAIAWGVIGLMAVFAAARAAKPRFFDTDGDTATAAGLAIVLASLCVLRAILGAVR